MSDKIESLDLEIFNDMYFGNPQLANFTKMGEEYGVSRDTIRRRLVKYIKTNFHDIEVDEADIRNFDMWCSIREAVNDSLTNDELYIFENLEDFTWTMNRTKFSITNNKNGGVFEYKISKDIYNSIIKHSNNIDDNENFDKVVIEIAIDLIHIAKRSSNEFSKRDLKRIAVKTLSKYAVIKNNHLYIRGEKVENYALVKEIVNAHLSGDEEAEKYGNKLAKFMERLYINPETYIVNELFGFISNADISIDDSGMIIGYRAVRHDYKDKYSGTMDNSVGNVLYMDREEVDSDPNESCSNGLHVGSLGYAKSFASSGDRLIKVMVDPYDVCSVPTDYRNGKLRCCKFIVLEDVTDKLLNS